MHSEKKTEVTYMKSDYSMCPYLTERKQNFPFDVYIKFSYTKAEEWIYMDFNVPLTTVISIQLKCLHTTFFFKKRD